MTDHITFLKSLVVQSYLVLKQTLDEQNQLSLDHPAKRRLSKRRSSFFRNSAARDECFISNLSEEQFSLQVPKAVDNSEFYTSDAANKKVDAVSIVLHRVYVYTSLGGEYNKVGWVVDEDLAFCMICRNSFDMINWRHHCHACGNLVCSNCSSHTAQVIELPAAGRMRICNMCYDGQEAIHAHIIKAGGKGTTSRFLLQQDSSADSLSSSNPVTPSKQHQQSSFFHRMLGNSSSKEMILPEVEQKRDDSLSMIDGDVRDAMDMGTNDMIPEKVHLVESEDYLDQELPGTATTASKNPRITEDFRHLPRMYGSEDIDTTNIINAAAEVEAEDDDEEESSYNEEDNDDHLFHDCLVALGHPHELTIDIIGNQQRQQQQLNLSKLVQATGVTTTATIEASTEGNNESSCDDEEEGSYYHALPNSNLQQQRAHHHHVTLINLSFDHYHNNNNESAANDHSYDHRRRSQSRSHDVVDAIATSVDAFYRPSLDERDVEDEDEGASSSSDDSAMPIKVPCAAATTNEEERAVVAREASPAVDVVQVGNREDWHNHHYQRVKEKKEEMVKATAALLQQQQQNTSNDGKLLTNTIIPTSNLHSDEHFAAVQDDHSNIDHSSSSLQLLSAVSMTQSHLDEFDFHALSQKTVHTLHYEGEDCPIPAAMINADGSDKDKMLTTAVNDDSSADEDEEEVKIDSTVLKKQKMQEEYYSYEKDIAYEDETVAVEGKEKDNEDLLDHVATKEGFNCQRQRNSSESSAPEATKVFCDVPCITC